MRADKTFLKSLQTSITSLPKPKKDKVRYSLPENVPPINWDKIQKSSIKRFCVEDSQPSSRFPWNERRFLESNWLNKSAVAEILELLWSFFMTLTWYLLVGLIQVQTNWFSSGVVARRTKSFSQLTQHYGLIEQK